MAETLTGRQLKDRADACLDQRKLEKETLRAWIARGADQIDRLAQEVQDLQATLKKGSTEAALLVLEEAHEAAERTLNRVQEMEASAEAALDDVRATSDAARDEARAEGEAEADSLVTEAVLEAGAIVDSAREVAKQKAETAQARSQRKLEAAFKRATRVDDECQEMLERASALDNEYQARVSEIKYGTNALVDLVARFDALSVTTIDDELNAGVIVDDLAEDMIDLTSLDSDDDDVETLDAEAEAESVDVDAS